MFINRVLLYGIIRSIRPIGPLDGLMGGRFILAFLSVLCILMAKMLYVATVFTGYDELGISVLSATLMIGLQFVPQLMMAIFTTIGFSWNSFKLIPYHPDTLLLSSGTHKKMNKQALPGYGSSLMKQYFAFLMIFRYFLK